MVPPTDAPALAIDVLGPLRVRVHGEDVTPKGHQASALLVLTLAAGRPVHEDSLIASAYGSGYRIGNEDEAVMNHVSRVRTRLGDRPDGKKWLPDRVRTTGLYYLDLPVEAVDAFTFSHGIDQLAENPDRDERLQAAAGLLPLWRSDPITAHHGYSRSATSLFKPYYRLRTQLVQMYARDLISVGDLDTAEGVVEEVLLDQPGNEALLVLSAEIESLMGSGKPWIPPEPEAQEPETVPKRLNAALLEHRVTLAISQLPPLTSAVETAMEDTLAVVVDEVIDASPGDGDLAAVLQELTAQYPGAVGVDQLCAALAPAAATVDSERRTRSAISRANSRFGHVAANQLHEFRVVVADQADEDGDVESVAVIRPIELASLLAKSPTLGTSIPTLQAAVTLYDAGAYSASIDQMIKLCRDLKTGTVLSTTQLTVFLYFLSKCLLKLNLDTPLRMLLDGLYLEATQRVCPELESERLQVIGVLNRQSGDLSNASAALDEAVEHLGEVAASTQIPVVWRALADAEVLRIHPRLDRAVRPGQQIARQAALRFASDALIRARSHLERFWQESGETTHYEGRLHGTSAFVTVARSVVDPDALEESDWVDAVRGSRAAFEPEHARKPIGIVAGRASLAAVHGAHAIWLRNRGDEDGAQEATRNAIEVLDVAYTRYLPQVELGAQFESTKLDTLRQSLEELKDPACTSMPPEALTPIL